MSSRSEIMHKMLTQKWVHPPFGKRCFKWLKRKAGVSFSSWWTVDVTVLCVNSSPTAEGRRDPADSAGGSGLQLHHRETSCPTQRQLDEVLTVCAGERSPLCCCELNSLFFFRTANPKAFTLIFTMCQIPTLALLDFTPSLPAWGITPWLIELSWRADTMSYPCKNNLRPSQCCVHRSSQCSVRVKQAPPAGESNFSTPRVFVICGTKNHFWVSKCASIYHSY